MTYTIVATGDSARNWKPLGYSIGVNDSWKFGKPTDALLICNRPQTFNESRLHTIIKSKPEVFYSWRPCWADWFPKWKKVRLHPWYGTLVDFPSELHAYSINTSPFIAISLAYNLGAREIITWGVDFINHHIFNPHNPETEREVDAYIELFDQLNMKGVKVYRGAGGTAFDDVIPQYAFD